jgi:hypothetical protein
MAERQLPKLRSVLSAIVSSVKATDDACSYSLTLTSFG